MKGALALMYHAVRAPGDVIPATDYPYSVAQDAFARQLAMVRESGYVFRDPSAVWSGAEFAPQVVLTFDDSWVEHVTVALPMLRDAGIKAFFFLTTEQLDKPGMLAASQVAALSEAGMVVGSHGVTHRYFDSLDEEQLFHELVESRKRLTELSGQDVTWLSLPGGRGHAMLAQVAEDAGYTAVATSHAGLWQGEDRMPRMPVMDGTDDAMFRHMLQFPGRTVLMRGVRQAGKEMLRRGLGNRMYDWLRNAMLPRH